MPPSWKMWLFIYNYSITQSVGTSLWNMHNKIFCKGHHLLVLSWNIIVRWIIPSHRLLIWKNGPMLVQPVCRNIWPLLNIYEFYIASLPGSPACAAFKTATTETKKEQSKWLPVGVEITFLSSLVIVCTIFN